MRSARAVSMGAAALLAAGKEAGEVGVGVRGGPSVPKLHGGGEAPAADNAGGGQLLTPPPPAAPRFNGPRLYGARPGRPFLHRIPVTGRAPLHIEAVGLPAGLELDPRTRTLRGTTPPAGEYPIRLAASNEAGRAERVFRIVSGSP